MKEAATGILMMAYGSAPSLEDQAIHDYLQHILQHYRKVDPEEAEFLHLKKRYQAVGGSPLYCITENLVKGTQHALELRFPGLYRTHLAMKHSPPYIEEVVSKMAAEGIERAIAVALAPFPSRLSSEGYYAMVREANEDLESPMRWSFAEPWNLHPLFLKLWQDRIQDVLQSEPEIDMVVFTNHSLPAVIRQWNDPYPKAFESTAGALAEQCALSRWDIAFQSQGSGRQEWLGPSLSEVLAKQKRQDNRSFLIAPVGFLMDHLEILFDLDVEAQSKAGRQRLRLTRTRMPNDDPLLVAMLVDVICHTAADL